MGPSRATLVLDALLIIVGSAMEAFAVMIFLAPSQISPTGASGIAYILFETIGTPLGLVTFLINIPVQIWAYRVLGGSRVIMGTVLAVVVFAITTDIAAPVLGTGGVSDNSLLNAVFGGIMGGIGVGLVYRGGGTVGGSATVARILQVQYGFPLSSAFLYADAGVLLLAGLTLGWEPALLATLSLFVGGLATDYILEGPSTVRTITIVTNHPNDVADVLLTQLDRGVTAWRGTGMYTRHDRHILFVVVTRAQVNETRLLVHTIDPKAFLVVSQGHAAYGEGFKEVKRPSTYLAGGEGT